MATCKATTQSGKKCQAAPIKGGLYCFTHDPSNGAARAKAHRLGGERHRVPHFGDEKSLPREVKTLEDAGKILSYTLAEVIPMENSIARARVLLALYDSFVKSFEIGELENRLAALEATIKRLATIRTDSHNLKSEASPAQTKRMSTFLSGIEAWILWPKP